MRVLLIEDEPRLAANVARMLEERAGYAVDRALDGETGLDLAAGDEHDLIVLDLMLPGIGGMEVLRRLRKRGRRTPVLVLTALSATDDVVRALEAGSDDYLTKPFEMAELFARCRALIRRSYDRPDPVLRVGSLTIDTARRSVQVENRSFDLPAMEYALLEYLALRAGEVVSKREILEHLYDFDRERFSNVVEVYVSAIRKRFGAASIRTIRNQGYVLTGDAV
jgi:two-component system response regulator PhoP